MQFSTTMKSDVDPYISALENLYVDHFSHYQAVEEIGDECSQPLLISLPDPEKWRRSQKRVLVIGQETKGWCGSCAGFTRHTNRRAAVKTLMDVYIDFNFAKNDKRHRGSPFWRAFRLLDDNALLWTNIFKLDYRTSSPLRAPAHVQNHLHEMQRGLLRREIDLLSPHVLVFFSGPFYDDAIRESFSGAYFEDIGGYEKIKLARMRHDALGEIAAYRLYHPNYISRSGGWPLLRRLKEESFALFS